MPEHTRPGDVLADRYRLTDLLTESGGGRFWRAFDSVLQRDVAVHIIACDDDRAPLLREAARTSATVLDRRMLRVLDIDEAADRCFVVNEWGSGTSLDILLADGEPLSPTVAAWIVAEVADTLALAHEAGVAHGRLVPENVLIDHDGAVRLIGFAVDAALHGLPSGRTSTDVVDLVGLLYAALTGRWAGVSRSVVTAAPLQHGHVLRPRQVRAGIPRTLDALCDHVLNHGGDVDVTAAMVSDTLRDFLGPSATAAEAWLARIDHPRRGQETVVLPALPDPPVRDQDVADEPADEPDVDQATARRRRHRRHRRHGRPGARRGARDPGGHADLPRRQRRGDLAPPPPRAGAAATAVRAAARASAVRPRPDRRSARPASARAPGRGPPGGQRLLAVGEHRDRCRHRQRRAAGVRGRRGGGRPQPARLQHAPARADRRGLPARPDRLRDRVQPRPRPDAARGGAPTPRPPGHLRGEHPQSQRRPGALTGVTASDFDPQGTPPEENPEQAHLAVDGDPATAWSTSTYNQNFGPGGLKTGVGLVLDLGADHDVSEVDLTTVGSPTRVQVYVTSQKPTNLQGARGRRSDDRDRHPWGRDPRPARHRALRRGLADVAARPAGGFRGEIAEVVVKGD